MYQPTDGDHVTVTRRHPDGRTGTWTGVLSGCHANFGFTLTGTGPDGKPMASSFASADSLRRLYGVDQTVTPIADG